MRAAVWLPSAKWAGWLALGLFLPTAFYLAVVALFAVTPLVDISSVGWVLAPTSTASSA